MTVSYPLTVPANLAQARISLSQMNNVSYSMSPITYQGQAQALDGEGWVLEVSLASLVREDAAPWIGFLTALRGKLGTFMFGDINCATPLGDAGGTPLVKGANQTGHILETDGWTHSMTGIMKAGDYFQIGQRLYMVVKDSDSDSSGNATLDIWPALRSSPADNAPIITENAKGLFKLTDSTTPIYTIGPNKAYQIGFSAVEPL